MFMAGKQLQGMPYPELSVCAEQKEKNQQVCLVLTLEVFVVIFYITMNIIILEKIFCNLSYNKLFLQHKLSLSLMQ